MAIRVGNARAGLAMMILVGSSAATAHATEPNAPGAERAGAERAGAERAGAERAGAERAVITG